MVITPADNEKDLEDIPEYIQKDLKFMFVKHMDEVLNVALVRPPKSSQQKVSPTSPVYLA